MAEPGPEPPEGVAAPAVIRLSGDLDASGIEAFHEALAGALVARAPRLVVDLTDVTEVGRAGVDALLRATRLHPDVRLRAAPGLRASIELHGVEREFDFDDER